MFRLFVDECGHHDMKSSSDPNQRYLGLTGIIMRLGYADGDFTQLLNGIKLSIFGRTNFSLHRREIMDATTEPFTVLKDRNKRREWDAAILGLIDTAVYRVVTVVIDKREHKAKYLVWHFQPYHYCMTVLLERYALWLKAAGCLGDVLAESRQIKDNKRLAKAYRFLYKRGTDNIRAEFFQQWLSSKEIKLKSKEHNIAGLQLADLIANPSCRDLVCRHTKVPMVAEFSMKVVEILYRKKYRRNPFNGTVPGWGTKWLP
jgi:uncharacterized protein DUF3800